MTHAALNMMFLIALLLLLSSWGLAQYAYRKGKENSDGYLEGYRDARKQVEAILGNRRSSN